MSARNLDDRGTNVSCPKPWQPPARPTKPGWRAPIPRIGFSESSGGTMGEWGHSAKPNHNSSVQLMVNQDDMEAVASLFGRITAMKRRRPLHHTERDAEASLGAHVRVIMRALKERLDCLGEGPLQDVEVIMAKHGLYSVCFKELIAAAGVADPTLSCVLETLRDAHCDLFESLAEIVRGTLRGCQQEISILGESREHDAKEAAELIEAARALEKEAETQHRHLRDLNRRLGELEEENASLKDNSTGCPPLAKPRAPQKNLNRDALHGLRARKSARTTLATPARKICDVGERTRSAPSAGSCRTTDSTGTADTATGAAGNGANMSSEGRMTAEVEANDSTKLSVERLKSLISSIFVSKEKHDRRCAAQRLPSQTLATHLEDFLVHRYGLTPMARIQAAALWEGVEAFRDEDNSVKVFEMILRHEVDERFRLDQQNLEQTIVELIRARIRDRAARHEGADVDDRRRDYYRRRSGGSGVSRIINRPRKAGQAFATASAVAIDSLVRSQTRPGASLAAADWQAVVGYLYRRAPADVQTVGVLVKEAMGRGGQGFDTGAGKGRKGRAGSRGSSIPFGVFLQVLLGYQLHGHLRWLRCFKDDFQKVDVDADGVLNPTQFLTLAKRTLRRAQDASESPVYVRTDRQQVRAKGEGEGQDKIDRQAMTRLRAADPHGCGRITFSECVDHLVRNAAAR